VAASATTAPLARLPFRARTAVVAWAAGASLSRESGERFGFYRTAPARPVIWLHAVSLGETRAAEPLLRALQQQHPDCDLLITQMTATGREAGRAAARWQRAGSLARLRLPIRRQTVLRHFRHGSAF